MLKVVLISIGICLSTTAAACISQATLDLAKAFEAEAVVVGSAWKFEPIPNPNGPQLAAAFQIKVREVLSGDISDHLDHRGMLPVSWFIGMGVPSMPGVDSVFVLQNPSSSIDASWIPQDRLTVLQQPCGPAHIFDSSGDIAKVLGQVLDGEGDAEMELKVLEEFLFGKEGPGLY
ncbi:hypothetical protein A9Q94_16140 [Rhodobacterales bacterium 56_14_T64]|nr:hypothetical protein A9Q94_16140 [Rhodobacterales bacterium 56_14_T64]